MTSPFPFSAVVGMDDMRLALVLNAISPAILRWSGTGWTLEDANPIP